MTILVETRALLETGTVCDNCLGRPFAARSFGLSNAERGRGLRTTIALADDEDFTPPDPNDCWVCEGICDRFDTLAARAIREIEGYEFVTYQVGTRTPPLLEENERLFREEAGLDPDAGERLKKEINREVGKRIGRRTGTEVDFDRPDVQFLIELEAEEVEATVNSSFVYGRYRKLERGIPQTEWPCSDCNGSGRRGAKACPTCEGSGYRYDRSVEQLVAPVIEDVMRGTDATFHGAGREDVDARMLGTGRPFVVEIDEPRRRTVDVDRLEEDINAFADGAVEVEGLRLASYEMVERVKRLEASKRYRVEVQFGTEIDAAELKNALETLEGALIEQYTPRRVDHRRAAKTRARRVYETSGSLVGPRSARIEVHGQGGLYVKELISGDEGRTDPSLAGLLDVDAEVTGLDVLAVEAEEGSFEDTAYLRTEPEANSPESTDTTDSD